MNEEILRQALMALSQRMDPAKSDLGFVDKFPTPPRPIYVDVTPGPGGQIHCLHEVKPKTGGGFVRMPLPHVGIKGIIRSLWIGEQSTPNNPKYKATPKLCLRIEMPEPRTLLIGYNTVAMRTLVSALDQMQPPELMTAPITLIFRPWNESVLIEVWAAGRIVKVDCPTGVNYKEWWDNLDFPQIASRLASNYCNLPSRDDLKQRLSEYGWDNSAIAKHFEAMYGGRKLSAITDLELMAFIHAREKDRLGRVPDAGA